jgi:tRNA splicing endonuclease
VKFTEIPLIDYIDIYDEQCDIYVHTKDKRMLVFKDVQSNGHLDDTGFSVDYIFLSKRMTAFISRDDFSHLEYCYSLRDNMTKESFNKLKNEGEEITSSSP